MAVFILALLLMLVALLALTLQKTYFYMPYKELKRQAAGGDRLAATLFRAAAYGAELKVLLWLFSGLAAAGGFMLLARIAPPIFGFVAVALVLWLAFLWVPRTRLTSLGARLSGWCTPFVVWCLRLMHPLMQYLAAYAGRYAAGPHTGIYQREDIYELIEQQKRQSDSRISDKELELMRNVLQFSDYQVRDCLVPSKRVKAVNVDENIGPVMLDELHTKGYARFPVYEGKATNIVGSLAVDDITDIQKQHGKVRDHFDERVAYLHEADSLEQALQAFYETRQHLFVVVNGFNEYVGIITLSDILHQLVGVAEHEAFGRHDDRKAVAARHRPKIPESLPEETAERLPENSPEVVE
jgi:metal transporter CNNM